MFWRFVIHLERFISNQALSETPLRLRYNEYMSAVTEVLDPKRESLEELCRNYDVQQLSLFGSAVRPDFDFQNSDLDFLVVLGEPRQGMRLVTQFFGFLDELEKLFGRHIDLLEESAIENNHLRRSALSSAVTIYAA